MLTKSGNSVPSHWGNVFSILSLKIISIFNENTKVPSVPRLLSVFIMSIEFYHLVLFCIY